MMLGVDDYKKDVLMRKGLPVKNFINQTEN